MNVHVPTRRRREKRSQEISFKVSPDEKAAITAAAKSKGAKVATLIRKSIFEYGVEVEVPEEEAKAPVRPAPKVDPELMLKVAKISNFMSQIATLIKEHKGAADVVPVIFALVALDQTLCDCVHGLSTYRK